MLLRYTVAVLALLCAFESAMAQSTAQDSLPKPASNPTPAQSKWYDKISLRGYSQFRYNRLLETNPEYKCDQCDRGIGKNQTFEVRRARLIISGQVHSRIFLYLQFDYSADVSDNNKHFLQVRDAYADYAFDKKREFRLRFGQSKVPYGFDVMQSSSNRVAFDRSDAFTAGIPNERDFGAFFYYAPHKIRERFKMLIDSGLKGSGDYGVFGFGIYNGQTTNKPELNDYFHTVARVSYPFVIGSQILEPGIQAYSGLYTISPDKLSPGVKALKNPTYHDERVAASMILYPRPFGIQAEYNIGRGPEFDPASDSIRVQGLKGGYIILSYRNKIFKNQSLISYVRYQTYNGGKKIELDAAHFDVKETEIGVEWEPFRNLEITLGYVISHRKYSNFKTDYDEKGRFLRLQLQVNY